MSSSHTSFRFTLTFLMCLTCYIITIPNKLLFNYHTLHTCFYYTVYVLDVLHIFTIPYILISNYSAFALTKIISSNRVALHTRISYIQQTFLRITIFFSKIVIFYLSSLHGNTCLFWFDATLSLYLLSSCIHFTCDQCLF